MKTTYANMPMSAKVEAFREIREQLAKIRCPTDPEYFVVTSQQLACLRTDVIDQCLTICEEVRERGHFVAKEAVNDCIDAILDHYGADRAQPR